MSRSATPSLVLPLAAAAFLHAACATDAPTGPDEPECSLSVSLNADALDMRPGQFAILEASVGAQGECPAATVAWTSSDEAVATVRADGRVEAVGEGSAAITARATAGRETATATVPVLVALPECEVTVSPASLTLEEGLRAKVSASVSGEAGCSAVTITWESGLEEAATVDQDGKVTAIRAATTTISARALLAGTTIDIAAVTLHVQHPTAELLLVYPDLLTGERFVGQRDWVAGETGRVDASPLTLCADQGGTCDYAGQRAVFYGGGGQFSRRFGEGPVACSDATFGGDPEPGAAKSCYLYMEGSELRFDVPEGDVISDIERFSNRSRGTQSISFRTLRTGTVFGSVHLLMDNVRSDVRIDVVLPFVINRWSFNENGGAGTVLEDRVGDNDARIVEGGPNDAVVGGGSVRLTGGSRATSDFVRFDDRVIPNYEDVTIELWATTHEIRSWARIFDFGKDAEEFFMMSWTRGGSQSQDRLDWSGYRSIDDSMAPYELNRRYHIVVTLDADLYENSSTVTWYRDGVQRGTFTVEGARLWGVTDFENNMLGRSNTPSDETGSASYDEFRVWQGALTAENVRSSFDAGPEDGHPLDVSGSGR